VLLQTAPDRGLPGGEMESFLRVMRELEHHPHIARIPAPHLWQLSPLPPRSTGVRYRSPDDQDLVSEDGALVATLQLHVRKEVDDADVFELTSVVKEQCMRALGVNGASITVGLVKA